MVRNIKLTIAYDGGGYHGFQRQNNAVSIQNILEARLHKLFGHVVQVAASGRTDTGVHAYGQVVSFFTEGTIPTNRIALAMNSELPDDIVVLSAEEADPRFHARHSARSKVYIYKILQADTPDPFLRNYAWYVRRKLDLDAMREALRHVLGTHDFSAFCAAGSVAPHPVRTLYLASCDRSENHILMTFWGNGFLYHMVRNLVGSLLDVGRGRTSPARFKEILDGLDRGKAGATAPAHGLYLKKVFYEAAEEAAAKERLRF